MDEINLSMSTSREFVILLNYPAKQFEEARHSVVQAVQLIREQRYTVHIADRNELKRFSPFITSAIFTARNPGTDGQQYIGKDE